MNIYDEKTDESTKLVSMCERGEILVAVLMRSFWALGHEEICVPGFESQVSEWTWWRVRR